MHYGGRIRLALCLARFLLLIAAAPTANRPPESSSMATGDMEGRWRDLDYLLTRQGNVVGPGFEPGPEIRDFLQDGCR